MARMRVVGLTGGVASGKSVASRVLARDGVHVIDAEQLAFEATQTGSPGFQDLVLCFGRQFLTERGRLDYRRLLNFVNTNPDRRQAYEAIVIPIVNELALLHFRRLQDVGVPAVLYESTLLFETDWERNVDATILVATSLDAQRLWLMQRDGLTRLEADRRISGQLSLLERRKRATVVIDNAGSVEELVTNVRHAWGRLVGGIA